MSRGECGVCTERRVNCCDVFEESHTWLDEGPPNAHSYI